MGLCMECIAGSWMGDQPVTGLSILDGCQPREERGPFLSHPVCPTGSQLDTSDRLMGSFMVLAFGNLDRKGQHPFPTDKKRHILWGFVANENTPMDSRVYILCFVWGKTFFLIILVCGP